MDSNQPQPSAKTVGDVGTKVRRRPLSVGAHPNAMPLAVQRLGHGMEEETRLSGNKRYYL